MSRTLARIAHRDAPYHFLEDQKTVDKLDLSSLVGPAANCRILFVRIGWSRHWKTSMYLDHPFIDREAAKQLVEMGVRVLGVDTMSPDETIVDGSEGDFGER
ncbi:hypothetical protein DFH11DRAFT_1730219 [Phellopilus nigrolimitatus]|nr:hypothetical protein DFH11DRAFT_1730219 [Phellopilus nigrolimitatus]